MTSGMHAPTVTDGEMSLTELCCVLIRRRRWIVATLVLFLISGSTVLLLRVPTFEATSKLRIGQVAGAGAFESPELLTSRLILQYGRHLADGVERDLPYLQRAAASTNAQPVVELVIKGGSPADAVAFLKRIAAEVVEAHDVLYRENFELLAENLRRLDDQRSALSKQYEQATLVIDRLKQDDVLQASLAITELSRIANLISELDSKRPVLAQKLSPPQTSPTRLLGQVNMPLRSAGPGKGLVLAVSAGLGLFAGIVLAFIAEWIAVIAMRRVR